MFRLLALCGLLLLIFIKQSGAQTVTPTPASSSTSGSMTTITVDTINRISKDGIPQDRPLVVVYPLGSRTVDYVFFYPINGDGTKKFISRREYRQYVVRREFIKKYGHTGAFFSIGLYLANNLILSNSNIAKVKRAKKYISDSFLEPDSWRIDKKPKNNTLFINAPALYPNTGYKFLLISKKGIAESDQLYKIWDKVQQGNLKDAKSDFETIFPIDQRNAYNITFDIVNKGGFLAQYNSNKKLQGDYTDYSKNLTALKAYNYLPFLKGDCDACLKIILDRTLSKDCKDCKSKYKGFIDSLDLFNHAIVNIQYPDTLFSKGYLSLANRITDKKAETKDFDQRSTNLKNSIAILNQIKYFINLVTLEENCKDKCVSLENTIDSNLKILRVDTAVYFAYNKARMDWKKDFSDEKIGLFMYNTDQSSISTNIFDFKTRNSNYINACFGLVTYGAVYGSHNFSQFSRFYDISPFAGVNINLRPIDKNLTLNQVPYKNFWTRTAIFAGISFNSVVDAAGTRQDFFASSTANLLLGGSYRFTNAIRLCYGAMLFKREDTNPLLDRKLITASPFVGLNIDLDLKELVGDASSIFK